jgi:hypothetical protein
MCEVPGMRVIKLNKKKERGGFQIVSDSKFVAVYFTL